jgi:hypothetical protein
VPGDHLVMPPQNRFRCNDSSNLLEHLATEDLAFDGEHAPLFIMQQDSSLALPLPHYSIFSQKIFDYILLLPIHPARKHPQQQRPGL